MSKSIYKKYNSFDEFNEDGYNLTEYIKRNTVGMSNTDKINYARKMFTENILNSYIIIGNISDDIKSLLNCSQKQLKFSMDNMIKNRLNHPEVTNEDYLQIPKIIKSPSKYFKSKSGYDVILFKAINKYYKLVIKTTRNRKENFVKSLHLLNEARYLKY